MNIKGIFKGTLISYLITALVLSILSILTYLNILSERNASIILFAAAVISVFIGALGCSKASGEKVLLNALSVSVLFCIVLLVISVTVNGGIIFHPRNLSLLGSVFAAGLMGALFGK